MIFRSKPDHFPVCVCGGGGGLGLQPKDNSGNRKPKKQEPVFV